MQVGETTLRPDGYLPRLADSALERLLRLTGAVQIEGPKWCGKTWLARNQARSQVLLQDPAGGYRNRRVAMDAPATLLGGDKPLLIDEWQDAPSLWDAVRQLVDETGRPGQFILTGSATPRDQAAAHSGTGRVARLQLWPMSSAESGFSTGAVCLGSLLAGELPGPTAVGRATADSLVTAIRRGGWPASVGRLDEDAVQLPSLYLDALANSDASRLDGTRRDPARLKALLTALARNQATVVTNATLGKDMAAFEGQHANPSTIADYLDVLTRLHILVSVPAWAPALRSPVRLREAPKRMLVDPSLAAAALHADADSLTADPKTLGFLFESLCLRDLAVYAAANGVELFHYRDNANLEVDAILARPGRDWAACEIKWSSQQTDQAATSLLRLRDKMIRGGQTLPAFLAVIVGVGEYAHARPDGVLVIPVDVLGA